VTINAEDDAKPLWQRLPSMNIQNQFQNQSMIMMENENETLSVVYDDKESKKFNTV
jgi:hypothetical protein